jgi:hypothetical protein
MRASAFCSGSERANKEPTNFDERPDVRERGYALMKRPLYLVFALAFAVAGAAGCKKADEAAAPAGEQTAPAAAPSAPAAPDAAKPGGEAAKAKKEKGKHKGGTPSAPGQAPAQPMPGPDNPET